jgi:hypothetical protein
MSPSLTQAAPSTRLPANCGRAPSAPGHVAVLRDWALCAGFRLCDESKPILLRLVVEAMIAGHALMLWMRRPTARDGRNRRSSRQPSRRRQSRVTIERRAGVSAPCAFSRRDATPSRAHDVGVHDSRDHAIPEDSDAYRLAAIGRQ